MIAIKSRIYWYELFNKLEPNSEYIVTSKSKLLHNYWPLDSDRQNTDETTEINKYSML